MVGPALPLPLKVAPLATETVLLVDSQLLTASVPAVTVVAPV